MAINFKVGTEDSPQLRAVFCRTAFLNRKSTPDDVAMPRKCKMGASTRAYNASVQELTTIGLRLFVDRDGLHWLHLGPNVALCLERQSQSEIVNEQLRLWLAGQKPVACDHLGGAGSRLN